MYNPLFFHHFHQLEGVCLILSHGISFKHTALYAHLYTSLLNAGVPEFEE